VNHPATPPAPSLWAATAAPAAAFPPLQGDAVADVAVIGGGYTGLAAAHHLASDGMRPIVLEANEIGWGASGRNGGVVSAKFRLSFPAIAAAYGADTARRMHALAHEAVDAVEGLIDTFGITGAAFSRCGHIRAAHTPAALDAVAAEAAWLRRELNDTSVTVLSRAQVREETGSDGFAGGVMTRGAGGLHPLNYVRGLAAGLARRGIAIHAATPATGIRRDGDGVTVTTPMGSVRARQAVIATNAYSDLTPATPTLARRLVPFRSAIIATAPLSPNLRGAVMPGGRICAETRRMMRWFRMADDRMVFGGRGAFGRRDSAAAFALLHRAMLGLFPMLGDTPVAFRWSGLVAMTMDKVPHVGRLDDRVLIGMGYNGAGVALASLAGRYIAAIARGERPDLGLLDTARFRPVPLPALRVPAVRLAAGWFQFLDAIGR
jgi:gamma-glutamylputrescine oxidase